MRASLHTRAVQRAGAAATHIGREDERIVEVLEVRKVGEAGAAVLLRAAASGGVAFEDEHFELGEALEVEDLLDLLDLVVAEREALERLQRVEAVDFCHLVVEEREVGEAHERFEALDLADAVEREVYEAEKKQQQRAKQVRMRAPPSARKEKKGTGR